MSDDLEVRPVGETRRRVLAGLCSCCGAGRDNDGLQGTPGHAIGERVWLCGWCIERRHDTPHIVGILLRSAVSGVEEL